MVAYGAGHILVLKKDESVWAAGNNFFGQFGNGKDGKKNENNPYFERVMEPGSGL